MFVSSCWLGFRRDFQGVAEIVGGGGVAEIVEGGGVAGIVEGGRRRWDRRPVSRELRSGVSWYPSAENWGIKQVQ